MKKQESKDITVQQVLEQVLETSGGEVDQLKAIQLVLKFPKVKSLSYFVYQKSSDLLLFRVEDLLRKPWSKIRTEVVQIVLHFDEHEEGPGDLTLDADQLSAIS